MSTIHELAALGRAPENGDVLVVDTGSNTCKLSYSALATAILNALSASGMNYRVLSGTDSNVAMAQSATVVNANNTHLNGKQVALVANNGGIALYNQTDGANVWNLPDPVTTAHGGTGANTIVGARMNLKTPYGSYADDTTWANLWANHLSYIAQDGHGLLLMNADAASVLSNGKITEFIAAVIFRSGTSTSRTFRVMAMSSGGGAQYSWIITEANSTSCSFGTVYRYIGTAI